MQSVCNIYKHNCCCLNLRCLGKFVFIYSCWMMKDRKYLFLQNCINTSKSALAYWLDPTGEEAADPSVAVDCNGILRWDRAEVQVISIPGLIWYWY